MCHLDARVPYVWDAQHNLAYAMPWRLRRLQGKLLTTYDVTPVRCGACAAAVGIIIIMLPQLATYLQVR
jgi:hypothetical protein